MRQFLVVLITVCVLPSISVGETISFLDRRTEDSFRVVNYNILFDSLFQSDRRGELGRLINAVDADVYNFQEVANTQPFQVQSIFNSLAPVVGGWQVHRGRNQVIVSRHALSQTATNVPGGERGIAMAQIDLPNASFANDMYILNNHFPCCGNEIGRQVEADALVSWLDDAMSFGGNVDLDPATAVLILGDLNIVGSGAPLQTLISGDGQRVDWDDTPLQNADPTHNGRGSDNWTWRNDSSNFDPGVLDYVLYTDSVIQQNHAFVLNPDAMTADELEMSGLLATDFQANPEIGFFDHLPMIVDFAPTRVTAIPEPNATLALLIVVTAMGRRRRKNRFRRAT